MDQPQLHHRQQSWPHSSHPHHEEEALQFEFARLSGCDTFAAADEILLWSSKSRAMGRSRYPRSESMDGHHRRRMMMSIQQRSRRLRRVSSADSAVPARGPGKAAWWSLLRFGLLQPQLSMDIEDMRSRQRRREAAVLSKLQPSAGGKNEANKGQWNWKLLRALSCKNNEANIVIS